MRTFASVCASMTLQIGGAWKSHVTIITLEWLLASMTTYVYNEIGGGAHRLAAEGAEETLLLFGSS